MNAVVIYESMYGNTRAIANAVAEGLRSQGDAVAIPVGEADARVIGTADLVVVGGPTHVHGMSRESTRKGAETRALAPGATVVLEPGASGPGLRDWFATLGRLTAKAAAFDTRAHGPAALTGRASKGITRELHRHHATVISEPHSFVVTKDNQLDAGEEASAREWGVRLGRMVASRSGAVSGAAR